MKSRFTQIAIIVMLAITSLLCAGCTDTDMTDTQADTAQTTIVAADPAQTEFVTDTTDSDETMVNTVSETISKTVPETEDMTSSTSTSVSKNTSATETSKTTQTSAKIATETTQTDTSKTENRGFNASVDRTAYHAYMDKQFDAADNAHIQSQRGIFDWDETRTWYFYNFANKATVGIGKNGETVHKNGYAVLSSGITDNRDLDVVVLSRNSAYRIKSVSITYEQPSVELNYTVSETDKGVLTLKADLYDACYVNGLYQIKAVIDTEAGEKSICNYLLVNCASNEPEDYHFYACNGSQHYYAEEFSTMTSRYKYLVSLLDSEGVTPETAASNRNYLYPISAEGYTDDSQYWIDKSHEILAGHENDNASTKALLLHDWMTSNLKYDYYKVNVLVQSRYIVNGLDPSQYVSQNYTGVCLDFSQIYTIMCRENGVPCVVLNNDSHAWNAIYLGSKWYEVDLTVDTNRLVYGEDTNDVEGADNLYCYDGFCAPMVNDSVPDTATRFNW